MNVNWPDLSQHTSDFLRLCGTVVEPTEALARWLKTKRYLTSSFRKKSKTYYVRFLTAGSPKKNHFHIEIASRAVFVTAPKSTAKLAVIESCFDKVMGLSLNLRATAEFEKSIAD